MISPTAKKAMKSVSRKIRREIPALGLDQDGLIVLVAKLAAFMNDCPTDGRHLWRILSALRGPDALIMPRQGARRIPTINGEPLREWHLKEVKAATSGVIRYSIGLTAQGTMIRLVTNSDSKEHLAVRKLLLEAENNDQPIVEYHFLRHAMAAFEALELDWNKVNR